MKVIKYILYSVVGLLVAFTFVPTSMSANQLIAAQKNVTASKSSTQGTFVASYLTYQEGEGDTASESIGGTPGEITIVRAMAHKNYEWRVEHGGITTDDEGNQLSGDTREVKGYVFHSIGASQPNAKGLVNTQYSYTDDEGSYHAVIDAKTGYVWQVAPWSALLWHGNGANKTCVGVETCEPPPSVASYDSGGHYIEVIHDKEAYEKYLGTTYYTAVDLCAWLCIEYDIDPLGKDVYYCDRGMYNIVAHDDVPNSSHVDPNHLWNPTLAKDDAGNKAYTEPIFTMDGFRKDVAAAKARGVNVTYIDAPYTTTSSGGRIYDNPTIGG